MQRHLELERLRILWTDAVQQVQLATPRSAAWNEARLLERHSAAEYLRELCDPYHDEFADPVEPASTS